MFQKMFPDIIGPLYLFFGTMSIFLLLKRKIPGIKTRITFLVISTLLGLTAFTPMFPVQFQELMMGISPDGKPIIAVAAIMFLLLLSTLIFGRIFCGYLCPVGAVSELAYLLKTKKFTGRYGAVFSIIRSIAFATLITLAVFWGVSMLDWFGIHAFFHMNTVSPVFYVFLSILFVSVFIYRPFCRTICPMGFMMSLISKFNIFRIQTKKSCTNCTICETKCPTDVPIASRGHNGECYLCFRCADRCIRDSIVYSSNKE